MGLTIKKAAILGLAHEPDQKLVKIKTKGCIVGLGPCRKPNWTGLILVPHQIATSDAYVASGGC